MLRVVLAVALATALLGVSMPAVQTARVDYAHDRVDTELERLAATATRLEERNDPAPPDVTGARRSVTLHLPEGAWTSADLAYLRIPGPSDALPRGTVRYRVGDGPNRTRPIGVPLVGPPGGLRVDGGRQRVVLEYTRRAGEPILLVRYPDFKLEATTRPSHDAFASLGTARRHGPRSKLWLRAGLRG